MKQLTPEEMKILDKWKDDYPRADSINVKVSHPDFKHFEKLMEYGMLEVVSYSFRVRSPEELVRLDKNGII